MFLCSRFLYQQTITLILSRWSQPNTMFSEHRQHQHYRYQGMQYNLGTPNFLAPPSLVSAPSTGFSVAERTGEYCHDVKPKTDIEFKNDSLNTSLTSTSNASADDKKYFLPQNNSRICATSKATDKSIELDPSSVRGRRTEHKSDIPCCQKRINKKRKRRGNGSEHFKEKPFR